MRRMLVLMVSDPRVCLPSRRRRFIVRAHHCGPPVGGLTRPPANPETACCLQAFIDSVHV